MVIKLDFLTSSELLIDLERWGEPLVLGHKGKEGLCPIGTIFDLNGQPFGLVRYVDEEEMKELSKVRGPFSPIYKYNYEIRTD